MRKSPTKIHDAWLLKPKIFGDARGFFLESWNRETFRDVGLDLDFVQDNHSRSSKYVLRGLHYQSGSAAQGKLVWVTSGTVFDVLVDLRESSPTFSNWDGYMLTSEAHERLWVQPGCAHGGVTSASRSGNVTGLARERHDGDMMRDMMALSAAHVGE